MEIIMATFTGGYEGQERDVIVAEYATPETLEGYDVIRADDGVTILYAFDPAEGHLLMNPERDSNYMELKKAVLKTRPGCVRAVFSFGMHRGDGIDGFTIKMDGKTFHHLEDTLMDVEELEECERRLKIIHVMRSS